MRIISGQLKGKKINYKLPQGIRPTSDFVRESIFNILSNIIELENKKVLDLFSGTGFLGLEALSRGANYCCFIDLNIHSVNFIKKIINDFQIDSSQYDIIKADVRKFIRNPELYLLKNNFDIIFCDPPYDMNVLPEILNQLNSSTLAYDKTILIYEVRSNFVAKAIYGWNLLNERIMGDTKILIFANQDW